MEELKFASINDAIQHLSDIEGQKIIIAAFTKPKAGDIAVIHHPQSREYYVFKLNNENIRPGGFFGRSDLLNESYSESMDERKIDLDLDKKYGLHSRIKDIQDGTLNLDNASSILFADYKKSDRDLDVGNLVFETERKYTEIIPISTRLERIKRNPNRAKKHVKDVTKDTDVNAVLRKVHETVPTFSSVEEAIQFLADKTGKRIEIAQ